jgi:UDP-GlcNAc3NAcA epimerase
MYDVTLAAAAEARRTSRILETLQLAPGAYAVATIHRAENTDDPRRLGEIVVWLNREADRQPVIVPLHPRTKQSIAAAGIDSGALRLVPPLGYLDMSRLLDGASTVFTDSGGLQKEAYFHRKPCVTLREETEWIETIEAGWNRLWRVAKYRPRHDIDEYGDGHAADRIAEILVDSADG